MKQFTSLFIALSLVTVVTLSSCTIKTGGGEGAANVPANASNNTVAPANAANSNGNNAPSSSAATSPSCMGFKKEGKVLVAKQTFPFDHEPFRKSCFVTFANKADMVDEKDVPRGSRFHIYTDGKDVFEFPDAFGGQSACWVEAIGFDDLNGDGKTDVMMAGSCLGAKDSYPANAVFANVGRGFVTNEEANSELDEFKTVDQIKGFVKKNVKRFFE